MELYELMTRIQLPKEAQEVVSKIELSESTYQEWRTLFYRDTGQFLEKWKNSEEHLKWILVFYLRIACEVYEDYKKMDISDKVFEDTFYDITIWCEECYRKYGFYGLEEAGWISVSAQMKLFRLGRLQFEPIVLEEDMRGKTKTLKQGAHVLNVHIPAGEKLDYAECQESFKRAKKFFRDSYEAYVCDSWLLAPALRELLSENSNIVKFQRLFEIVNVHHKFPQAEQRIFQDVRVDKENYPENTILQKKAKEYILAGHDIGIGVGFFI